MENNRNRQSRKTSTSVNWKKVLLVVIADILLLGACLSTFALFHHVLPKKNLPDPVTIQRPTDTPAPAATQDPSSDATAQPTEVPPLSWAEKFADKFSTAGIVQTDNSFISQNTHVTITKVEASVERSYKGIMTTYPIVYYVADIYITEVDQFSTAFSDGGYQPGTSGSTLFQVRDNKGVVGVNGDN